MTLTREELAELPFDKKIKEYKKIAKNKDTIIEYICNGDYLLCASPSEQEHTFMGNLILSIPLTNDKIWTKRINKLYRFINSLMTHTKIRTHIMNWFAYVLNVSSILNNFSSDSYHNALVSSPSYTFLVNTLSIICLLWTKNSSYKPCHKINNDYITDKRCFIKWSSENNNKTDNKYNFLTECFFLLHNAIRVIYAPLTSNINKWLDILADINDVADALEEVRELNTWEEVVLCRELRNVGDMINIMAEIPKNNILRRWINKFYDDCIDWIKLTKKNKISHDVLDDILDMFVSHILDPRSQSQLEYVMNRNTNIIALDIIRSKKYTHNPNIRFRYFTLLQTRILDKKFVPIIDFVYGSVILHNDLDEHKEDPFSNMQCRMEIYRSFVFLVEKNDICESTINHIFGEQDCAKKFANIILNDAIYLTNIINDIIDKASCVRNEYDKMLLDKMIHCHDILLFERFAIMLPNYKKIKKSKELLISLAQVIGSIIKIICNSLNMLSTSEKKLAKIIVTMTSHVAFICRKFDGCGLARMLVSHSILDTEKHIKYFKCNDDEEMGIFYKFMKKCKKIAQEQKNYNPPDEFLDPLTYNIIEEPVLLPDVGNSNENIFFEKSVIMKYLLNKSENPYTRVPLFIKEFEKYNSLPENAKIIKNFKKKLYKYINDRKSRHKRNSQDKK